MKTLFDLRKENDSNLIKDIQNLYKEDINIISFEDQEIKKCIGCWNCWLKTPGTCVMKDDLEKAYVNYINSDTVIVLMDTAQGFINHQAKAFIDRSIPHYLPYIIIKDKECQHAKRYDQYADLVFYYDTDQLTQMEEQVIEDYLYRTAYHHKSKGFRLMKSNQLTIKTLNERKPKNKQLEISAYNTDAKLIIYNGSPRKVKSNSGIILKQVKDHLQEKVEIRDLKDTSQWTTWANSFFDETHVLFFMPLYVHAMPSHVMAFIEKLAPSEGSLSFFIQSGFPESSQSFFLEAYFEQLTKRLGRTYGGTAIKGGIEGLQMRPISGQIKMVKPLVDAVIYLENHKVFSEKHIKRLSIPVHLNALIRFLFWVIGRKIMDYFWNSQLKSNGALEKAYNRPYALEEEL
jgi:multimeric flavodoxin WrbA